MLKPLQIGSWRLPNNLALAPMAGVTDRVFRTLCREQGAGYAVAEMTHSKPDLRNHRKSLTRRADSAEPAPHAVQLLGHDPQLLADAARWHVDQGADIIDLNLGCPAKKVCNVAAGSALMSDPARVAAIFEAVVAAVPVPVTVKMRTGTDEGHRNAPELAWIAQESGLALVTIHGRTRSQRFQGEAEYDTLAEIAQRLTIPVLANGDIDSGDKARHVLKYTGAAGVMVGRASFGNPWIFGEIRAALTEEEWIPPSLEERVATLHRHVRELHAYYGETTGVRLARKHAGWYARHLPNGETFRNTFVRLSHAQAQLDWIEQTYSHAFAL
ncbi:tRNA-U20-dihydrouridine synthase [Sulfurivirga caldicuralii]|uniref:tRNA-dihydrouridine synthase n=1 Tax=Sulfurivirga caldicuralii TaxID=364032 RepID=A0A1N6DUV8_9GAMM|nr:tRNA dihydrouridine synthase DusB [Sulfurivirga caldicuralii]SIN74541.1 tRNA-U20-dihydrouridine synthase [Sulfurivirga caldicuralii]